MTNWSSQETTHKTPKKWVISSEKVQPEKTQNWHVTNYSEMCSTLIYVVRITTNFIAKPLNFIETYTAPVHYNNTIIEFI